MAPSALKQQPLQSLVVVQIRMALVDLDELKLVKLVRILRAHTAREKQSPLHFVHEFHRLNGLCGVDTSKHSLGRLDQRLHVDLRALPVNAVGADIIHAELAEVLVGVKTAEVVFEWVGADFAFILIHQNVKLHGLADGLQVVLLRVAVHFALLEQGLQPVEEDHVAVLQVGVYQQVVVISYLLNDLVVGPFVEFDLVGDLLALFLAFLEHALLRLPLKFRNECILLLQNDGARVAARHRSIASVQVVVQLTLTVD